MTTQSDLERAIIGRLGELAMDIATMVEIKLGQDRHELELARIEFAKATAEWEAQQRETVA